MLLKPERSAERPRLAWAFAWLLCGAIASWPHHWTGALALEPVETVSADALNQIRVDEISAASQALIERAAAQKAAGQAGDAFALLRQVLAEEAGKLVPVGDRRYLPVDDYIHSRLASYPAEILSEYRSQIDPRARNLYETGLANRDGKRLQEVVDRLPISTYGDDALQALGDLALERGEFWHARACLERIHPQFAPRWPDAVDQVPLVYPDTDLDLAAIAARLALVSVLEGNWSRAQQEIDALEKTFPGANGRIAGRNGPYASLLRALLASAREDSTAAASSRSWPTFAGAPRRTHVVDDRWFPLRERWSMPLADTETFRADSSHSRSLAVVNRSPDDPHRAACSHPAIANSLVFYNTADEIFAFNLETGKPAWPGDPHKPGRIFNGASHHRLPADASSAFGAPQYTLTIHGRWLLARMGSAAADPGDPGQYQASSYLVGLDLEAEGRMAWPKIVPDRRHWEFAGTPVADGRNFYVAMRAGGVRPQMHVACYDLATGERLWRRFICEAESAAEAPHDELTQALLTLDGDWLFVSTGLGAVAALDASGGQIRWLATYPRSPRRQPSLPPRAPAPAVSCRGTLCAAPSDYEGVMALDAASGRLRWESSQANEAAHMLGVAADKLWLSGRQLWALDLADGSLVHAIRPENAAGNGRGILAAGAIYWPLRAGDSTSLLVVDTATGRPRAGARGRVFPFPGGNLAATADYLVVAGAGRLTVFGNNQRPKNP